MLIRPAQPEDLGRIGCLLYQIHQSHADRRPDIFIPGQRKYGESDLEHLLADPTRPMFVAEENGEVAGYCLCMIDTTEGKPNLRDRKVLYVDDLCVDEPYRRHGIGSGLIRYIREWAREKQFDSLTLNVWAGNEEAERLYRQMGFFLQKSTLEFKL